MVQPVVTRSQRRIERKQVVLVVVLILAVAGVSFFVGVLFGQRGGPLSDFSPDVEKPTLSTVTTVAPSPPPVPEVAEVAEEKSEKLTFYDNLPKGNQAPLGSGINLPPEQKKPEIEAKKIDLAKPASSPPEPTTAMTKPATAPAASSDGAFVVQVASFRTWEDAGKLATRLKSYKLTTYVESADLGAKGVWYRVLAGPYDSRESADQAAGLMKEKERLSALVRKR
jgi:cell division septation protein DedD